MTLRQRIEQRITDLHAERAIAAAATPGPWSLDIDVDYTDHTPPERYEWLIGIRSTSGQVFGTEDNFTEADATHIATQDPATTITRIDRELAGCAADLALLDWLEVEELTGHNYAMNNLKARYPSEESA